MGRKMNERSHGITRRSLVRLLTAAALTGPSPAAIAQETSVTVHKDPNCGCCTGWVQHLRESGFTVGVEETPDLDSVRTRLGVPRCHTAEVAGYVVEGHVPAAAVRRLLAERPNAKGLAVPGMPVGSPGMEGGRPAPYTAVLLGADGPRPFMRFVGDRVAG
jgi:hypothetical protein